jgi:hypothetical protein
MRNFDGKDKAKTILGFFFFLEGILVLLIVVGAAAYKYWAG